MQTKNPKQLLTPSNYHEMSPPVSNKHGLHVLTSSQQSGGFIYNEPHPHVGLPVIVATHNGTTPPVGAHHVKERSVGPT